MRSNPSRRYWLRLERQIKGKNREKSKQRKKKK